MPGTWGDQNRSSCEQKPARFSELVTGPLPRRDLEPRQDVREASSPGRECLACDISRSYNLTTALPPRHYGVPERGVPLQYGPPQASPPDFIEASSNLEQCHSEPGPSAWKQQTWPEPQLGDLVQVP